MKYLAIAEVDCTWAVGLFGKVHHDRHATEHVIFEAGEEDIQKKVQEVLAEIKNKYPDEDDGDEFSLYKIHLKSVAPLSVSCFGFPEDGDPVIQKAKCQPTGEGVSSLDSLLVAKFETQTFIEKLADDKTLTVGILMDPAHLIRVRLVLDSKTMKITLARAEMPFYPFKICLPVTEKVKALEGLVVDKEIMNKIQEIVGGETGCFRLRDLVREMISHVFKHLPAHEKIGLLTPEFEHQPDEVRYEKSKEILGGTCLAFPGKQS